MTIKARFIGDATDPKSDPDEVAAFGVSFVKGEWTDAPKSFADKIAANSHFEIDTKGDGTPDPTVETLRAELDAKGIKYSPRAGIENLQAKLDEANAAPPPPAEVDPETAEARQQLDDLGVDYGDRDDLDALNALIEEATNPT